MFTCNAIKAVSYWFSWYGFTQHDCQCNSQRDWRIYADFALVLVKTARQLYINEDFGVRLKHMVYALDSTTIDLCLSLFPWAQFRKHKVAVKIHTLLDLRGNIPTCIWITSGKVHDVAILKLLTYEAGAYYLCDRAYIDYSELYRMHTAQAFFITRTKSNSQFRVLSSLPVKKSTGVICDQLVDRILCGATLSRKVTSNSLLRQRARKIHHFFDQQRYVGGSNNRSAVQVSLENRIILQMDQTASTHQSFLWDIGKMRSKLSYG